MIDSSFLVGFLSGVSVILALQFIALSIAAWPSARSKARKKSRRETEGVRRGTMITRLESQPKRSKPWPDREDL